LTASARRVARIAKAYPQKLAELRARRSQPPPFDLGFDPARSRSAAGHLDLLRKAELLGRTTRQHLHDKILITATDLHPDTREILRFFSGLGDAGCHHGMYLAALSYWFGRYHGLLAPAAAEPGIAATKARAHGTMARLAGELAGAVRKLPGQVGSWVAAWAHRLESQERCVTQHVRPLAVRLVGELRRSVEATARAFMGDLGPSLATLAIPDRHAILDDATMR
jgi:hypothetical protein